MKSRITRIEYAEVKNLGDFETVRVTAEAEIHPDDKAGDVMVRLKKWVKDQLDEEPLNV